MTTTTGSPRTSARERLLASADELFYQEGVHSVGIDRVIEHAGVAKASLYNSFGSKEELVQAYLQQRHEATSARLTRVVAEHDDPRAKILAIFDSQGEVMARPGFRGCAFSGASAEAKPGGLVEESTRAYRDWIRALFTDLAGQAGAHRPAELARQLHLLYDGAASSGNLDHDAGAAHAARGAAEVLVDVATHEPG
jgi:AcrR family transcriptional regulator